MGKPAANPMVFLRGFNASISCCEKASSWQVAGLLLHNVGLLRLPPMLRKSWWLQRGGKIMRNEDRTWDDTLGMPVLYDIL
jgi:hypothetical protein